VPHYARCATDGAVAADAGAPRDPREGAMRYAPDAHVVRDLDLVVELDASSITVSSSAPRSMVVSRRPRHRSPMTTRPVCGI